MILVRKSDMAGGLGITDVYVDKCHIVVEMHACLLLHTHSMPRTLEI